MPQNCHEPSVAQEHPHPASHHMFERLDTHGPARLRGRPSAEPVSSFRPVRRNSQNLMASGGRCGVRAAWLILTRLRRFDAIGRPCVQGQTVALVNPRRRRLSIRRSSSPICGPIQARFMACFDQSAPQNPADPAGNWTEPRAPNCCLLGEDVLIGATGSSRGRRKREFAYEPKTSPAKHARARLPGSKDGARSRAATPSAKNSSLPISIRPSAS